MKYLMIFFALIILACKDKEPTYDKTSYPIKITLIDYFKDIPSNKIDSHWVKNNEIPLTDYSYFLDGLELYLSMEIPASIAEVKMGYNLASYPQDLVTTAISFEEDKVIFYKNRNDPFFGYICAYDCYKIYSSGIHTLRIRAGINIDKIKNGYLVIQLPFWPHEHSYNDDLVKNYAGDGIYFPIVNGELIKGLGTPEPDELQALYEKICKNGELDCPFVVQPILYFGGK